MEPMKFYTAEEASELLGGLLSARAIQERCRNRTLEFTRGSANRILFSADQVRRIPEQLTQKVVQPKKHRRGPSSEPSDLFEAPRDAGTELEDPFGGTELSRRAHARKQRQKAV